MEHAQRTCVLSSHQRVRGSEKTGGIRYKAKTKWGSCVRERVVGLWAIALFSNCALVFLPGSDASKSSKQHAGGRLSSAAGDPSCSCPENTRPLNLGTRVVARPTCAPGIIACSPNSRPSDVSLVGLEPASNFSSSGLLEDLR